jgi:hypothetical protein
MRFFTVIQAARAMQSKSFGAMASSQQPQRSGNGSGIAKQHISPCASAKMRTMPTRKSLTVAPNNPATGVVMQWLRKGAQAVYQALAASFRGLQGPATPIAISAAASDLRPLRKDFLIL